MRTTVLLIFCLFATSANAMLVGDTINCATSGASWSCDTASAVVTDPGTEFGIFLHTFRAMDLDITDNSLEFDAILSVGNIFGIGPLSLSSIDSEIVGFTFSTNINGMNASRLSFTASSFDIDFDLLTINSGEFLDIDLQFLSPVPVPAAAWLFGSAIIGLAGFGRRRKPILISKHN